jgi:hypothetical protein
VPGEVDEGAVVDDEPVVLADEVRVFEDGALVATHAPLEGRGEKRLDPSHRKPGSPCRRSLRDEPLILTRAGDHVCKIACNNDPLRGRFRFQ